jgi:hypothetical protein
VDPQTNAMPYDAYPAGEDLKDLLDEAGIDTCNFDTDSLDQAVEEAIDNIERDTGYKPLLQSASASYFYDPPGPDFKGSLRGGGRILELARGFTSVTAVALAITPTDSVGEAQTVLTDYNLLPYNAVADGVPYTAIEFKYPVWGLTRSVKVTGTPGYAAELPASLYRAILKLAGSEVLKTMREGLSQSPVDWSEADVHERSSIELIQKLGNSWSQEARRTIRRFTLVTRY